MVDEAMQELLRQVEAQAEKLERNQATPGTCPAHPDMERTQALTLRLLLVQAKKGMDTGGRSITALAASVGLPTPVCALLWFIGQAKGWW